MATSLKSIALRTSKLNETKDFFENDLGFEIDESSYEHFVLYSKDIRIVFISSDSKTLEVELYVGEIFSRLENNKDPNDIKIMGCFD